MIETETTSWKLSDLGRRKLNSDDVIEPGVELLLRVVGMMDRPTTRQNIINVVDSLIDIYGGVEEANQAIINGEVKLEWVPPLV